MTDPEPVPEPRKRADDMPKEPPPGALLLTVQQTAYLTGYSCRQLRAFAAAGKLRSTSLDGRPRFRRGDVLRLIDGKPPRD